jgi:NADPH:quinone reductase-like Zn-dependent oxidoreductase
VEVEVKAVGINFRDVLNVLGMYPGDPGPPGGDCAGIVTRVPAGSTTALKPGDAVFGLAAGSLGSHVIASAKTVVPMPSFIRQAAGVHLPAAVECCLLASLPPHKLLTRLASSLSVQL